MLVFQNKVEAAEPVAAGAAAASGDGGEGTAGARRRSTRCDRGVLSGAYDNTDDNSHTVEKADLFFQLDAQFRKLVVPLAVVALRPRVRLLLHSASLFDPQNRLCALPIARYHLRRHIGSCNDRRRHFNGQDQSLRLDKKKICYRFHSLCFFIVSREDQNI